MTKSQRIQRKRTRGFDMQAVSLELNGLPAVYVGRPTKFGNPFLVEVIDRKFCVTCNDRIAVVSKTKSEAAKAATRLYIDMLCSGYSEDYTAKTISGSPIYSGKNHHTVMMLDEIRNRILEDAPELQGKNVACFCPPNQYCHADILAAMANDPDIDADVDVWIRRVAGRTP